MSILKDEFTYENQRLILQSSLDPVLKSLYLRKRKLEKISIQVSCKRFAALFCKQKRQ